jgi:hypothetical protein
MVLHDHSVQHIYIGRARDRVSAQITMRASAESQT